MAGFFVGICTYLFPADLPMIGNAIHSQPLVIPQSRYLQEIRRGYWESFVAVTS